MFTCKYKKTNGKVQVFREKKRAIIGQFLSQSEDRFGLRDAINRVLFTTFGNLDRQLFLTVIVPVYIISHAFYANFAIA